MEDAMKEEKTLARREFTLAAAMAALGGVAITISACGGGSSPTASTPAPTPTPAPPAAADKTGVVGSNHGHAAVVTAARLTAGATYSLDIQGSSSHPHSVEITAAELTAIAASSRVSKESSTDSGHSHTVTFN
jgi:xanthosine utilization system XapX-like protein